jgi:hypothetical protein
VDTIFFKPPATSVAAWVTQLETWLATARAEQAEGASISYAMAGEVASGLKVSVTPERRIEQLLEALNVYDPTNYPDSILPVRRTTVRFL